MHKAVGGSRRRAGRPSAMGSMMFRSEAKSPSVPRFGRTLSAAARAAAGRFRRDQRGVTAIEFGAVAAPFFALLFAIIETALTLWTTQVLETGSRQRLAPHLHGAVPAGQRRDRSDPHRRQVPRRDLQEHRRPDHLRQDPDRRPHPRLLPGAEAAEADHRGRAVRQRQFRQIRAARRESDRRGQGRRRIPGLRQPAQPEPVESSERQPPDHGNGGLPHRTLRPIGSFRCVPSLIRPSGLFAGSRCGSSTLSRPARGSPPSSSRWCCR